VAQAVEWAPALLLNSNAKPWVQTPVPQKKEKSIVKETSIQIFLNSQTIQTDTSPEKKCEWRRAQEKILNMFSHQKNANSNHDVMLIHNS
jgi:hypothetical protein